MAMFDNGDRAEATELRMIEKYARAAFKAGWDARMPPGVLITLADEPHVDRQFDEWWKESQ